MKVYIYPEFSGPDKGDGGVRRVVEAQRRWLPTYGVELVESVAEADVLAAHIAADRKLLKQTDKPLVAHSHGLYWAEYEWEAWALKANETCMETIRCADAVTAPSEWVANAIRRATLRRVAVVGHGVDLDEWKPLSQDPPYVLWNKTRTDPVCDPAVVVELAERAPDVPFVTTYGRTNLSNVTVTGRLSYADAHVHIERAGVYLATPRETFGIGTLEAMACGVPVLGWRWGGQADIVEHRVTGYLAEPGNLDDLVTGLRYCLENREKLGKAARKAVQRHYQWKDVVKSYADIYAAVLDYHNGMAKAPKVSVVVPAYNLADYLGEALDSVAAQSVTDWECIVVDDASPDRSGKIADEYAAGDKRFRVIHNEENQYLAGALNTGIAAAKGQYILPLDADNKLTPNTLRLLADALDGDRSLDIAYGNVLFVTPGGEPDQQWPGGHSGWPMEFKGDWQLYRRRGDGGPSNLVPSTALYRRRVWELTGGYRRRYRTAEDADFWTRAASFGFRPAMVTKADTLIYRNRPNSMSQVTEQRDWTAWLPWAFTEGAVPTPAGAITDRQQPVQSYDPPLVAVIVPVGPGHEGLLVDALDSVMSQTYDGWECIVINDSGQHLTGLPSWATLIDGGGPAGFLGAARARNLGIAAAKAPLFVPLDADDTLEAKFIELTLPVYERFRGYVYTDWNELKQDQPLASWQTEDYNAWQLLRIGCMHAVTGLYPKAAWEQVGGFDEDLPAWEDWDFQLKLANIGCCGTRYPVPLFTYRTDTGMRRDDNYANFERSKEGIKTKWGDYFSGKETLMGCRSCSGGGGHVAAPQQARAANTGPAMPPNAADYVMIEYVGAQQASSIYKGPSGQTYRFGNNETDRLRYALPQDAEYFANRNDFRVVTPDRVPVEAATPGA